MGTLISVRLTKHFFPHWYSKLSPWIQQALTEDLMLIEVWEHYIYMKYSHTKIIKKNSFIEDAILQVNMCPLMLLLRKDRNAADKEGK